MRKIFSLMMAVLFCAGLFANSYWYRGGDNSWGATAMTVSTDGLYEYIQSSNNANQFKIAASEGGWDYNWTYVQKGFNSTDVTNIGDYGEDNCYCWQSGAYYILVYYPNTKVNATNKPIICASTTLPEASAGDQLYVWNGVGVTTAAAATEEGGAAEAVQASGTNVEVGVAQKGNWCLKSNKGFSSGANYLGIAMTNGVNAGDTVKIAYFRTGTSSSYVLGMDFSADKASAATTYQIKASGDPQVLESNGKPVDSIYIVPEGVEGAKYMRIYRVSGSTGLWVAKVELVKKVAAPEPPTPVDSTTLYFVNTKDWTKVQAYLFNDADPWPNYKAWPGEAMIKTGDKALEKDVYKYTFPSAYNTIIFNNKTGDEGEQLANAKWDAAKPYYCDGEWFASLEEIKPVVPAKFYVTGDSALIVDAGYDKAVAWHSDAIKSEKDTFELSLKGGQAYQLQVVVGEAWKGYKDLSKKAEGLKAGGEFGNDICFSLNKDGKVQVVYFVKDEQVTFELIGDFYVKPVVKKELKLVPGVWAEAEAKIAAWIWGKELAGQWTAFFAGKDTLKAEINADADSIIFMRYNKTVESPLWSEDGNIVWGRMDADTIDYVGLTYTITDWKKGQWTPYVAPVYEHENGYYLMGSHNEWAIDDAYKFTLNETAEGGVEEYKLDVTLTVGQKIKPAYVENDKAKDWYPAEGGDFEVTADYAGAKTVYFRPVRNGEWGAFGGFIYIDANPSTAISNTAVEGKAVKTISNGMLIIEKAGVRYNVMGQIIR